MYLFFPDGLSSRLFGIRSSAAALAAACWDRGDVVSARDRRDPDAAAFLTVFRTGVRHIIALHMTEHCTPNGSRNVRGYFQISSLDCTTHHQARRHSAIFDNSDYSGEGKLQYFEFDTIEWVSERCPGLLNMMVYIHFGPHGTHNSMLTTTDYFGIRLLLLPLH